MQPIALNEFLNYRFLSAVTYAPHEEKAAFVVSACDEADNSYQSRLYLYDGAVRQLTDLGKESAFVWEDDGHLLFPAVRADKDKKRAEDGESFTVWYRLDLAGGEAVRAFELPLRAQRLYVLKDGRFLVRAALDVNHPDEYLMNEEEKQALQKERKEDQDYEVLDETPFWRNGGGFTNKRRSALFLYDPAAEKPLVRLTAPTENVGALEVFDDYALFDVSDYEVKEPVRGCRLEKLCLDTLKRVSVLTDPQLAVSSIHRLARGVLLTANRGLRHGISENDQVYRLDPDTGDLSLLLDQQYSMYGSVGSDCRYGGGQEQETREDTLYYVTTREGDAHLYRLTPDGVETPVVTKPGSVDCFSLSPKGGKALMVAMYDMKLQELYEADLVTGEVRQISDFNEEILRDKYVATPEPLTIISQGLSVTGWILKPFDYNPEKTYPAVLDIHGGPKTVYGPVFYHEMQHWAGLGYFVFFCNPKGSDGRDNEFADIFGHYGETDYLNLMDFTDAVLKACPHIDPARVCETGGSYGGFMTNWIIGHTDRFVCAASQRSISNWLSFFGVSDIGPFFATDQNRADFYTEPEKLWEHSPLKYAANVVTPTLFIHSDEDYRCPLPEGLQMYTALADRGVPARLCLFHGENHELSRSGKPKHRVRRLKEITGWFEKYAK